MSATKTPSAIVLEQASKRFLDAAAKPPFLYEPPAEARKVLDDVQAVPIESSTSRTGGSPSTPRSETCACASWPEHDRRSDPFASPLRAISILRDALVAARRPSKT